jgi:hypothetical protein
VDYQAYLWNLSLLPAEAPLRAEHLASDQEYEEGAAYNRKIGAEGGVSLVPVV